MRQTKLRPDLDTGHRSLPTGKCPGASFTSRTSLPEVNENRVKADVSMSCIHLASGLPIKNSKREAPISASLPSLGRSSVCPPATVPCSTLDHGLWTLDSRKQRFPSSQREARKEMSQPLANQR